MKKLPNILILLTQTLEYMGDYPELSFALNEIRK